MLQLIKNSFLSERRSYRYYLEKDAIKATMVEVFRKSGGFFTGPDVQGRFNSAYHFQLIRQPSFAIIGGQLFYTLLYGTISALPSGETVVETEVIPPAINKFLIVVVLAIGAACFYHSVRQPSLGLFIVDAIVFLLCPVFILAAANLSKAALQDRYERYIHSVLQQLSKV